jgi:hypothetical protein
MQRTVFWDIMPCSLLKVNQRFGGIYRLQVASLPPAFTPVSCLAYFSTLKIQAICSSEMSVDFQWTTQHYIPEDSTVYNHCCENLESISKFNLKVIKACTVTVSVHLFSLIYFKGKHTLVWPS